MVANSRGNYHLHSDGKQRMLYCLILAVKDRYTRLVHLKMVKWQFGEALKLPNAITHSPHNQQFLLRAPYSQLCTWILLIIIIKKPNRNKTKQNNPQNTHTQKPHKKQTNPKKIKKKNTQKINQPKKHHCSSPNERVPSFLLGALSFLGLESDRIT